MDRRLSLANELPLPAPDKRPARSAGVLWRSLSAVAIGAVLGTLAGARYDVLFGLSDPVCALLQSLLFTATWTYAGQARASEMTTTELYNAEEEHERSTVLEIADR
jgi:hypothetical protein